MHDCEVRIDDTSISRYQCLIEYLDPRGWVLYDGNKKNKSTNGTWLYIDDYYQITNGMRFKAGQSLFRVINMQCILGEDLVHI